MKYVILIVLAVLALAVKAEAQLQPTGYVQLSHDNVQPAGSLSQPGNVQPGTGL